MLETYEGTVETFEQKGYTLIGIERDGSLNFALYEKPTRFNDLMSINNNAFLAGTIGSVKMISESNVVNGMYKMKGLTKEPVVLRVSSASFTDKRKKDNISVGNLTI